MKNLIHILIAFLFLAPGYTQDKAKSDSLLKLIKAHNTAVHLLGDTWMRDPFIVLGPDDHYYLTMTYHTQEHNIEAPVWKSADLVNWELLGYPYSIAGASNYDEYKVKMKEKVKKWEAEGRTNIDESIKLWAPELHFINGKWVIMHTSNTGLGNFAISNSDEIGNFNTDWGTLFQRQHDPTVFIDDDGKIYLGKRCAEIQEIKLDLSGFAGEPIDIGPSNRRMGHEGIYIIKIKNKYVLFGTAWSTDKMRHGTYNLYYCTADKVTGPYGPRKFAGRFLGHGTPFKDKEGRWWCTAFFNANEPPLSGEESLVKDVSETAYTINKQGLTIVPLEIKMVDGDVEVTAKDIYHKNPGKEEVQQFEMKK